MVNKTRFPVVASVLLSLGLSGTLCAELSAPPFVLNCGPDTDEARFVLAEANEQREISADRLVQLPDLPYSANGFGHRGGEGYWHWHGGCRPSLGAGWEVDLFSSGRIGPGSYSFGLAPGEYQIAVGVCEGHAHAPKQRVFDIVVNDKVIAKDVDPIAWAGYKEPMVFTARVRLKGDPLTVSFRAKTERPAIVSAIWVVPASDAERTRRVSPPADVQAVGSYQANLLSWHRPKDFGIRGFLVRRRSAEGNEFKVITPNAVYAHRWIDRDVVAGKDYAYQVGSRGESGDVRWSDTMIANPRSPNDSTLPVYSIELPVEARRRMLSEVHEDQPEKATFHLNGKSYSVEIRIRGASTRYAAKKSYRIRFTGECPFARKVIYLKAEPMDHTLQQEKLSCDLFGAVGVHCSTAAYTNLFMNGRFEGVYLDIEPVRSPFKKNEGLAPEGTLIRANTFQHSYDGASEKIGDLRGDVGSLDQLKRFINEINETPRGGFEQFVRENTDWPRVMDYLALIVLTHRTEIEANDYFFYRTPDSGRWSFIPWDHNNGNFHVQSHRNQIGEPYIHVFPQTIQQLGWQPSYWYVLPSRIFHSPSLRREYLDRLEELTKIWLVSGKVNFMIDANFAQLRNEYPLDPHRWPFVEADPFVSSCDELKQFIRLHARQILRQIELERNRRPSSLVINEFKFGEKSGWVELHNRGDETESLRRVQLVAKNAAGNWRLSLHSEVAMKPSEYRVIRIPHRPIKVPEFADAEARERWEMERWRARKREEFPGYSPDGGFLGLVQREITRRTDDEPTDDESEENGRDEDDDDRVKESVLDFYFYGPLPSDESYGRLEKGFGTQVPTPREPNAAK